MELNADSEIEIQLPDHTSRNNDNFDDDIMELPTANDGGDDASSTISPVNMDPHERHDKPLGTPGWSNKNKLGAVLTAAAAIFLVALSTGIVESRKNQSAPNNSFASSAATVTLEQCMELEEYAAYAVEETPTYEPTTNPPTTDYPTATEDSPIESAASDLSWPPTAESPASDDDDDDTFLPIQYDDELYVRKLVSEPKKKLRRLSKKTKEEKIGRGEDGALKPAREGRRLTCDELVYEAYGSGMELAKASKSAKEAKSAKAGCGTKASKSTCSPTGVPTQAPTCSDREVIITTKAQPIKPFNGGRTRNFRIPVNEAADSDVTLRVYTRGDIDSADEFYTVGYAPENVLGTTGSSDSRTCGSGDDYIFDDFPISKDDFNGAIDGDNRFYVRATAENSVKPCFYWWLWGKIYRPSVYVELRYTVCTANPPPPPPTPPGPSCMSGDTRVPIGNYLADEEQDYHYVQHLDIGDNIKGLDENMDPQTCEVKAVGYFGTGEVFGNYTDHHYVLDTSNDVVSAHGPVGEKQVVDKYAVLTSCPVGVDESGIAFSAVDSDFVGDEPISWSDYVLIHQAILNIVEEVGPFVFSPTTYTSMSRVKEYTQQFYKTMLQCAKDYSNCDDFEIAAEELIDNSLTDAAMGKVKSKFSNLGNSKQSGSVAAAMSKGSSVRG